MSSGRVVLHVVLGTVVVGVATTAAGVLALLVGRPSGSVGTYVVVHAVLLAVLLPWAVRWWTVVGLRRGVPAVPWSVLPGLAAYLLHPAAWQGTALVGWQLVPAGVLSWLLDLVLWVGAVALGVAWATSSQVLKTAPRTPYG